MLQSPEITVRDRARPFQWDVLTKHACFLVQILTALVFLLDGGAAERCSKHAEDHVLTRGGSQDKTGVIERTRVQLLYRQVNHGRPGNGSLRRQPGDTAFQRVTRVTHSVGMIRGR